MRFPSLFRFCCLCFLLFFSPLTVGAALRLEKSLSDPTRISISVPADQEDREVIVHFTLPPSAIVSALIWSNRPEEKISARLEKGTTDRRKLSEANGPPPLVLGSASDSSEGPARLLLALPPSSDSSLLEIQVTWRLPRSARKPRNYSSALPTPSAPPATGFREESAGETFSLCRIVKVNWIEGASLSRDFLRRKGLLLDFSSPINRKMLQDALQILVRTRGTRPGYTRFEQIPLTLTWVSSTRLRIRFPKNLSLPRNTRCRLRLDGFRILSRKGSLLDAEGSALSLPSGDGAPGGRFVSEFLLP